eukprot:8951547-Heterocapsa_arctica.AAC.1
MADPALMGCLELRVARGAPLENSVVVGPVVGAEALVVRVVVCGVQRQVNDGQAGLVVATDLV